MPIVDRMLADANQPRDPVDKCVRVPHFDTVDIKHNVNHMTDQATVNRVHVAFHLNRAAAVNLDPAQTSAVVDLLRRQLAKALALFFKFRKP